MPIFEHSFLSSLVCSRLYTDIEQAVDMSKCILLAALISVVFVNRSDTVSTGTAGSPPTVFCYNDPSCNENSAEWAGACKTGQKQSPIDFPVTYVPLLLSGFYKYKYAPKPQTLRFNNGYSANSFWVVDNGHTVQIQLQPTATSSAEMTGYELNEPYVFAQAHFHWGGLLTGGSEHTIGGKHFTGEIHLVHYAKKYGSVAAAAASNDPKGIAVVGVFLENAVVSPAQIVGDIAMLPIVQNLPKQYSPTARQVNQPINLGLFLPKPGENVFRYEGSLTTPSCTEAVLWTVAEKPMKVSFLKLGILQKVQDEEGQRLSRNFRSVQPLNGRNVERFYVA